MESSRASDADRYRAALAFYRPRVRRAYRACCRLARARGVDPLATLALPVAKALLTSEGPEGSLAAEHVAWLVEDALEVVRAAGPFGADLVTFEGARFRSACGPRPTGGTEGARVRRAPAARVLDLAWDAPAIARAIGQGRQPAPEPRATRLVVALSPAGRVVVRSCDDRLLRLLSVLDGGAVDEVATRLDLPVPVVERRLAQLAALGVVECSGGPP